VKALIVGAGRVGSGVAGRLRDEGWDVVVVDESEEALGRLGPNWPGEFHLGHGMDTSVLEEAGIADADAFVASTDGDNTNLVVAQIAKRRFEVPVVIARILDPYRAEWYESQGVHTICPTRTAIDMLSDEVRQAAAKAGGDGGGAAAPAAEPAAEGEG
jgi:trk system potassium uptake protein